MTALGYRQVESIIRRHPHGFRQIFGRRQINNIYLDTHDMKAYYDNVRGNSDRIKVRIRWYGDTFGYIEKPVLELKIKKGLAGRKESHALEPFTLDTAFTADTLRQSFSSSGLPEKVFDLLKSHIPALLNSYSRKYFATPDRSVRITLDENMKYYRIGPRNNTFLEHYEERGSVIVEMKYDPSASGIASDISQHFPMRMTKSSKYVNGIDILHPYLAT